MEDTRPEEKRAIRRFTLQLPVTVTAKSGERVEADGREPRCEFAWDLLLLRLRAGARLGD